MLFRSNLRDTLKLPTDVPFTDGALVEPLACVMKSLRRGGLREGDTLYVIGLGVMGLMHGLAAQAQGAQVTGTDLIAEMTSSSVTSSVVPANVVSRWSMRIALLLSALPRKALIKLRRSVSLSGRKSMGLPLPAEKSGKVSAQTAFRSRRRLRHYTIVDAPIRRFLYVASSARIK